MNKKILIALALASIFNATQAADTNVCYTEHGDTDYRCKSCLNNRAVTCTACISGYNLDSKNADGSGRCWKYSDEKISLTVIASLIFLCLLCWAIRLLWFWRKSKNKDYALLNNKVPTKTNFWTEWKPCDQCQGKRYVGEHNILANQCMECGGKGGTTITRSETIWVDEKVMRRREFGKFIGLVIIFIIIVIVMLLIS